MSNSNFNFQNGQGYNSRGNQNYEGFNQDSSYRFQNNIQSSRVVPKAQYTRSISNVAANLHSARPEHKLRRD